MIERYQKYLDRYSKYKTKSSKAKSCIDRIIKMYQTRINAFNEVLDIVNKEIAENSDGSAKILKMISSSTQWNGKMMKAEKREQAKARKLAKKAKNYELKLRKKQER